MFFFKRKQKSDFHILIIDDDKDFLSSMAVWFKSQEYSVEAVASGEEALKILKKAKPNIIFLDFFMPGMDGLETLKNIRRMKIKVPVVMLSKDTPEDICLAAYALGINAILDKTLDFYNAQHLINSLARVVSRPR
ncbi:MAG: response regulator [Candidatus Omnitrophota bacterium]